ncbi:hypothetical protein QRB38_20225 [Mycobacterium avium subsp. hominissuis]|uniref:hypothetical protein n=1 Tax=Mycobacterium avium TaxID=1764 RepID=UPI00266596A0|nr:hypothetical protein [Mycobacterium avium]MDO2396105.1 hypothetical protein [Mycobacterium avium subsp. hominissuis]
MSNPTPDDELTRFFAVPPALARAVEPSRESVYIGNAEKNLYEARERRLAHLRDGVTRRAIDRATERLTTLAHPELDYIAIRSPFIYGPQQVATPDAPGDVTLLPPPLSRVLRRKNQYAIALYLTLLFVQQMLAFRAAHGDPGVVGPRRRKAVYNVDGAPSEASLIGLPSNDRRNQRRVFNRALDALQSAELIDYGPDRQRYATYALNAEDGSGHTYTVPAGEPDSAAYLCLPAAFFTAGWPMILTPSELATFLAICHYADRILPRNPTGETPRQIYLAKSLRDKHFGLSDEAYESIHTLAEFRLIDVHDPVEGRRRGRISPERTGGKRPDPYLLDPIVLGGFPSTDRAFNLDAFKQPAIETAIERLNWPIPRYAMWSGSSRKRDDARAARAAKQNTKQAT